MPIKPLPVPDPNACPVPEVPYCQYRVNGICTSEVFC